MFNHEILRSIRFIAVLCLASLLPDTAQAHHAMGGEVPRSLWTGLLSGFAHPVIGFDHLVFVLCVGLLAAAQDRRLLIPLPFIVFSAVGALAYLARVSVPGVEFAIALTILAGGSWLISARTTHWAALATFLGVAGLLHGYAYGEAIFGAEPTPLFAYLIGFSVVQYVLAVLAIMVVRSLACDGIVAWTGLRIAGGGAVGISLALLHQHLVPF